MPASVRVISIVKDPVTQEEKYTIEFECIAEEAKDLQKELMKTPLGQRAMELIDQAGFMPERPNKTPEELKAEAEAEERKIKKYEADLKNRAKSNRDYDWKSVVGRVLGIDTQKLLVQEMEKRDEEQRAKEEAQ